MLRKRVLWIAGIFIFAFVLRFWGIAYKWHYTGDQETIVRASANFLRNGSFSPDDWVHPPMKYYLAEASIKLFGHNPYGWRMKNVIFGSLSVLMVYLLGKELFRDDKTAFAASVFLLFEPVHIAYSRSILGEVPSIFFFLGAVYVVVVYLKGRLRSPIIAGFCLGVALAIKWYYIVPCIVLLSYFLAARRSAGNWSLETVLHTFGVFVLIPLGIYILQYYPWMSRGYSLGDLFNLQIDAYRILQAQTLGDFSSEFMRHSPSSPLQWFVMPVVYGSQDGVAGIFGNFVILMLNPMVSLFTFPAAVYALYRSHKDKDASLFIILVLFLCTYGQFAIVSRPLLLYSVIPVLPFAYLLTAYGLTAFCSRFRNPSRAYKWAMIVVIIWGAYLYPLVAGGYVPVLAYRPLFLLGRVTLL
ncbi:MAG: glycosyltransferase family 39 protein [Nitrospirae bacterium]|nr:glycosyltransferase family 39 protein [Nitrospirota bacterium]